MATYRRPVMPYGPVRVRLESRRPHCRTTPARGSRRAPSRCRVPARDPSRSGMTKYTTSEGNPFARLTVVTRRPCRSMMPMPPEVVVRAIVPSGSATPRYSCRSWQVRRARWGRAPASTRHRGTTRVARADQEPLLVMAEDDRKRLEAEALSAGERAGMCRPRGRSGRSRAWSGTSARRRVTRD